MTDATNSQPEVPPLTPQQVDNAEQIARFLDSDLANAVMQGNSMVIQAIAAGAQTTDQVVNMMLHQGALPEMMPPGVRELLQARLQENAAKQRAGELASEVAAGLGGALAGMAGGKALAQDSSPVMRANGGGVASYPNILDSNSLASISANMAAIASMSGAEFDALPSRDKEDKLGQISDAGDKLTRHGSDVIMQYTTKLEERVASGEITKEQHAIMVGAAGQMAGGLVREEIKGADGKPLLDKDGQPLTKITGFDGTQLDAHISQLPPHLQEEARKFAAQYKATVEAAEKKALADEALRRHKEGLPPIPGVEVVNAGGVLQVVADRSNTLIEGLTKPEQIHECVSDEKIGLKNTVAEKKREQSLQEAMQMSRDEPHTRDQNMARLSAGATGAVKLEIIEEEMLRDGLSAEQRSQIRNAAQTGAFDSLPPGHQDFAKYYREGITEGGDPKVAQAWVETRTITGAVSTMMAESDAVGVKASAAARVADGASAAEFSKGRDANIDARSTADAMQNKAAAQQLAASGAAGGAELSLDDEPAAPKTLAARLTINGKPLADAGQLQPEGVGFEVANQPKLPDPELQRRQTASIGAPGGVRG
jgi:hypothetical protein